MRSGDNAGGNMAMRKSQYDNLKLIAEIMRWARLITHAGLRIRFVPAAYEYPGDYLETRNKE